MAVNAGAETRLPLRGNEAFILARYDTTPVRGWTIVQTAWIANVTKKDPPPQFGFTAITTPWQEGDGLLNAPARNGATFEWAEFQKTRWRKDGLPFPYAIRGNAGSLFCIGTLQNAHSVSGGYTRFEIDPAIVQSLIAGTASGLVISDEQGQRGETWHIPSRETERAGHYLEVMDARRPDNRIPQQTRMDVYVEWTIPETVEPGMYFSRLDFAGASEDSVNLALEVLPITLPAQRPFTIEWVADPPPASCYGARAADTQAVELHHAYVDLVRERLRGTRTALWRQSAPPPLEEGPAGVADRIVRDFLTGAAGWSIKGGLGQPDDGTRALSARDLEVIRATVQNQLLK